MGQEIERKFLVVDDSYKKEAYSSSRIVQGYISNSSSGNTVRVRIRGEKGYLTIKGKATESGLSRYEWEQEIPLLEAEELLKLCDKGVIDKVRYLVQSGNHTFEVDEFFGENRGLVIAEVELANEAEVYKKPDFIGKEVTGEMRYYNVFLLKAPYSSWIE
ncbi:MAG: CYTH domain-containing protein [Phocaeicola sp.]